MASPQGSVIGTVLFLLYIIYRIKIFKGEVNLNRLNSSSAHPEPAYEGTPTDYRKDQAVFDAIFELFNKYAYQ